MDPDSDASAMSISEMQSMCRFCLIKQANMRQLDPYQLSASGIPDMFAIVTALKLDISPLHSKWICQHCEQQLRTIQELRIKFVRVEMKWKLMISACHEDLTNPGCKEQYNDNWRDNFIVNINDPLNGIENYKKEPCEDSMDFIECKPEPSDTSDSDRILSNEGEHNIRDTSRTSLFTGITESPNVNLECDICGDKTTTKRWMLQHIIDNHISIKSGSTCPICGKTNLKRMDMHMIIHRKRNLTPKQLQRKESVADYQSKNNAADISTLVGVVLECDICGDTTTKKRLMLNHMIDCHMPTTSSLTCPICGKTNLKRMDMHMYIHVHKNKYKCDQCSKGFSRLATLNQHLRTHSGERPFICEVCSNSFSTSTGLRDHQKRHISSKRLPQTNYIKTTHVTGKRLPLPTTCPVCGKTNIKRKSMAVHIQMHDNRNKYKCSHCSRGFERFLSLQQHERQHTGERPFICEICAFTFTSNAGLSNHIKLHDLPSPSSKASSKVQRLPTVLAKPVSKVLLQHRGIRPECPMCHSTFANRKSILGHMKLQHGAEGLIAWKNMIQSTCMVCYEKFTSKDDLERHRPVHFEHHCHLCRRHFHSKVSLDTHVQMHSTKSRPFKCELCDCAYTNATMLKIHFRRAHTDERPFQCNLCSSTFAEKSELSTHTRRVHSRPDHIKPYACSHCPSTFRSKSALRGHTENHTGEYRFWCAICQCNQHSGPQLAEHNRMYHAPTTHTLKTSAASAILVRQEVEWVQDEVRLKIDNYAKQ